LFSNTLRDVYEALQDATKKFAAESLIAAEGAFGCVYKGQIGATIFVAVKVMRERSAHNEEQLKRELDTLHKCKHPNLVALLGYSNSPGGVPCLVYDYKSHGTLRSMLDSKSAALGWRRRCAMLLQIGSAVEYLHEVVVPPIIHRDIKSTNILVDGNLSPSIGDFGLARLCPDHVTAVKGAPISTRIFGTPGYIDPEYAQTGRVSKASDIFSFAVVSLEMVSTRHAYDPSNAEPVLVVAFEDACENAQQNLFFDPMVWSGVDVSVISSLSSLLSSCTKSRSVRRPTIQAIASLLTALCTSNACLPHHLSSSSLEDESKCVVCLEMVATHAFIPCGHKIACQEHAELLQTQHSPCPLCRTVIENVLKIFS
jgi:serine/threonine protein kinase